MTTLSENAIESIRQEGLQHLLAGRPEEALVFFDRALSLGPGDDQLEILTINKARSLVDLGRTGPEVQALPMILMRRRNPRHAFLAAYTLLCKYAHLDRDYRKATLYGSQALVLADEIGGEGKANVLLAQGTACVLDSRTGEAIEYFERALQILDSQPEAELSRAIALQNLGYSRIISGEPARGVELIHDALARMEALGADGFYPESHIDLCYGYLELENFDMARHYGELGLAHAVEDRQIRNAHYLLGEVLYKLGRSDEARSHFECLGRYYPDFPNLTNLLLAFDLRRMVNLKL
jgi:tetratricopeptide (TPR) repeat protein